MFKENEQSIEIDDEHGEIYSCLLWQKTADLAKDYGYEMTPKCPLDSVCEGTRCDFLEPIETTATNMEDFYIRLEKHETLRRLAELRKELKSYTKK